MTRHIEPLTESPNDAMERIQRRIDGKDTARELLCLLAPSDIEDPVYMAALIERIREAAGLVPEEPPEPEREPIARLGATEIHFGRYESLTLDDVDLDYLDWLCREQEEFYGQLRAYLTHPDLQSHRGEYE